MRRTIQTAQHLPYPKKTWKSLDELDGGVCDGMTYEEIEERYPEDYAARGTSILPPLQRKRWLTSCLCLLSQMRFALFGVLLILDAITDF